MEEKRKPFPIGESQIINVEEMKELEFYHIAMYELLLHNKLPQSVVA